MESGRKDQNDGRFEVSGPRHSALHLVAEIRVTTRGKQVQFYWSGAVAGQQGAEGRVWRTTHSPPAFRSEHGNLPTAKTALEVFTAQQN